ncbi:MAG: hypothetical protein V3T30_08395 [Thermodesulfobacteriota bacterium]
MDRSTSRKVIARGSVVKKSALISVLLLLLFITAGCTTTNQYAKFAKLGTAYTSAMDSLLVTEANLSIDANSLRMITADSFSNYDIPKYQSYKDADLKNLTVTAKLREHNKALATYFGLLNKLAESNAPAEAQAAAKTVGDNLNAIGNQLRGNPIISSSSAGIAATVINLTTNFIIRGKLKKELTKDRVDMIRGELETQELVLKVISANVASYIKKTNQDRERILVTDPLTDTKDITDPDKWMEERRKLLNSQATVVEFTNASNAAKKLRKAYEGLISGKLSVEDIDMIITDIETIAGVITELNK